MSKNLQKDFKEEAEEVMVEGMEADMAVETEAVEEDMVAEMAVDIVA